MKKKSKRKSKNSQPWKRRSKPSLLTTTSSKRDKLIRILDLKSLNSKLSSEKDTPHSSKKSTTSSQELIPILMLTSKETPSSLKMKPKSNIITTKTNNSLNIGSKPSFPTMLLVRKSDKLMNQSSNIWPKSKLSKNLKTALKLFSLSLKTNGSLTLLLLKSSNLKEMKSKEALVMISTGKKERTSPSKLSKRKIKIKRKQFKRKFNLSSTSSKKLIWLKMNKKTTKKLNNKTMRRMRTKSQNSKDNMKSPTSFMKT